MKKQRKSTSMNKTNVLISQFHIKSTQLQKEEKQKKLTSTFSHFKQRLLHQDLKVKQQNQYSKGKRPIIEQLKFIVDNKEDDFKATFSMSKRSSSKGHIEEDNKRKLQKLNNQIFDEFYEEINLEKEKRKSTAYMWDMLSKKRYKLKSSQNFVMQKIEKTALQKFRNAISKQNNQLQNRVNQKNAEALYLLLKTGRSKNVKNKYDNREQSPNTENQSSRFPTETNEKKFVSQKNEINLTKPIEQKQNQVAKAQSVRPASAKRISTQFNDKLIKNKQKQQGKTTDAEEKSYKKQKQQILQKPEIKVEEKIIKKQQPLNNQRGSLKAEKASGFQQFSAQSQSQSFQNIKQKQKIQEQSKTKQAIVQPNDEKSNKQFFRPIKQIKEVPKQQIKIVDKIKDQQPLLKQQHKPHMLQLKKKESDNQVKKKDQKNQRQLFTDIPSGIVVDAAQKKKAQQKQKPPQSQKQSFQKISQNQENMQKILTANYLQAKKSNNNTSKAANLAPPPKLTGNPVNQNKQSLNRANYRASDVDQSQIQEVGWNGKAIIQTKPNKIEHNGQLKRDDTKQLKKGAQAAQKAEQANKNLQKIEQSSPQKDNQQDTIDQALDQLVFYTERMQDIGQYRVISKDLYNDKSIDKELVKAYKICSYYMAHQFLYLSQILLELLSSQNITRDYYTVSNQELIQLQKEGVLDGQIGNVTRNIQESKKLLKKCYDQCKPYLDKSQQILSLDGHKNYYKRCCSMLIKEFKTMLELSSKKPESVMIQKRCCYLIEMFCVLKMFNSQILKDYEQVQEISDFKAHIKSYKHFLIGS